MADNIENLILEHLRAIRAEVSGIRDDVREVKSRLTNVEIGISSLKRDSADQYAEVAGQHARYDRLQDRIERIE